MRLEKCIFVDTSELFCCYYMFVIPIFEYDSPVWGSVLECQIILTKEKYRQAQLKENNNL